MSNRITEALQEALKLCSLAETMTARQGDDDFIAGVRAKIEAALSAEPGVAVPVAWQLRQRYGDTWTDWSGITENIAKSYATESRNDIEIRPLYAETLSTEAEADRKRLDFLDQCSSRLNAYYGTTYGWKLILNHNVNRLMLGRLEVDLNDAEAHGVTSCRSAIDAEMKRIAATRQALESDNG